MQTSNKLISSKNLPHICSQTTSCVLCTRFPQPKHTNAEQKLLANNSANKSKKNFQTTSDIMQTSNISISSKNLPHICSQTTRCALRTSFLQPKYTNAEQKLLANNSTNKSKKNFQTTSDIMQTSIILISTKNLPHTCSQTTSCDCAQVFYSQNTQTPNKKS